MSHLSAIFGPVEIPETVSSGGFILCKGCSRGQHLKHDTPCHCDLCEETTA